MLREKVQDNTEWRMRQKRVFDWVGVVWPVPDIAEVGWRADRLLLI